MGLRLRHSFKLFPGVKLNVGLHGVSASFGVPGATVNLGGRGIRATVGLPGTGLSYTTNLSPSDTRHNIPRHAAPDYPTYVPHVSVEQLREINSHSIDRLTSSSLREVHQMILDAEEQIITIENDMREAHDLRNKKKTALWWCSLPIVSMFRKKAIERIIGEIAACDEELERLKAWREATHFKIEFSASDEIERAYASVVRAFSSAMNCSSIWDVTHDRATNRIAERTTAYRALNRKPVKLRFAKSDRIKGAGDAMQFDNTNGEDILIFPGILFLESPDRRFALIDIRDVTLEAGESRFIEEDAIPNDTEIVSRTWAKSNKDGSPDRRFKDNYQIPVCRYVKFLFKSKTGLNEEYMLSSYQKAHAFPEAFWAYHALLSR